MWAKVGEEEDDEEREKRSREEVEIGLAAANVNWRRPIAAQAQTPNAQCPMLLPISLLWIWIRL